MISKTGDFGIVFRFTTYDDTLIIALLVLMPRAKTILQSQHPYHLGGRCRNKEWFKLPLQTVWHIFSEQLTFLSWAFTFQIHSFVLMNNHFHLLATTPEANLSEGMEFFMRETTKSLNKESGTINQAFGGPHFRCIVSSPLYYLHCYKYIYANPVKAGLSPSCEAYPYSSLHFLLGQSQAKFPLIYDDTLFSGVGETLNWLNRPVEEADWDSVKNAISKSSFRLAKSNYGRNGNPLERFKL